MEEKEAGHYDQMLGRNKLIQFILTHNLQLLEPMILGKASWPWEHGVASSPCSGWEALERQELGARTTFKVIPRRNPTSTTSQTVIQDEETSTEGPG